MFLLIEIQRHVDRPSRKIYVERQKMKLASVYGYLCLWFLCLWIILQFLDYTLLSCILDQGSDNLRTLYSQVIFIPFSMNIYTLGSVTLGAGFGTLRLGCPLSPPAPPTSAWYQAESRVSGVDAGTSETSRGVWTDLLGDPLSEN